MNNGSISMSGLSPQPSRAGNFLAGELMGLQAENIDRPANWQESYTFASKRRVGEVLRWPQGARLRTVPFTPARVKAALAQRAG